MNMMNAIRSMMMVVGILCGAMRAHAVLQVQVWQSGNPTCGNSTGYVVVVAWGGTPPYTYLWNNSATTDTITGLAPGFYEVTVTDALSATATASTSLVNEPTPYIPYYVSNAGLHGCGTSCNSGVRWLPQYAPMNLVQPFTFNIPPVPGWNPWFPNEEAWLGLCGNTTFEVAVTDALGCMATLYDFVYENSNPTPMSVLSVNGACSGSSYGSAVVDLGVDNTSPWGSNWQGSLLNDALQVLQSSIGANCVLGQNIATVAGLPPGDYFLQRWHFNYTDSCSEYLPFTIPDLGPNCGHLSGNSWYNLDADCVRDANEVGVPNSIYEVLPGPFYLITNGNGTFDVDLPNGSYTIEQLDATLTPGCGMSQPWPFIINSNVIATTWVNTSTEPLDLEVLASAGAARPGFDQNIYGAVRNLSPQLSGPVTLTCTFDAGLTYVSATPTPASIVGNLVTWNIATLNSFGQANVQVVLNVPIGTALGTALQTTFDASNTLTEVTLANNTAVVPSTVTGSYDPNDKTALTSTRLSNDFFYITQDEYLDYTIRFQNTGTDTAFTVAITDTLDADLDMSTYEQGLASHPYTVQFLPERVVKWTFNNILLPDSNTNEAMSHGLVSFRIKPTQPLLAGTVLSNNADIFFDFNPPVRTNDAVVVAEFSTQVQGPLEGGLRVYPNPAKELLMIVSTDRTIRSVVMRSVDGRRVMEASIGHTSTALDVSRLADGLYAVLVQFADGTNHTSTTVKQ